MSSIKSKSTPTPPTHRDKETTHTGERDSQTKVYALSPLGELGSLTCFHCMMYVSVPFFGDTYTEEGADISQHNDLVSHLEVWPCV